MQSWWKVPISECYEIQTIILETIVSLYSLNSSADVRSFKSRLTQWSPCWNPCINSFRVLDCPILLTPWNDVYSGSIHTLLTPWNDSVRVEIWIYPHSSDTMKWCLFWIHLHTSDTMKWCLFWIHLHTSDTMKWYIICIYCIKQYYCDCK